MSDTQPAHLTFNDTDLGVVGGHVILENQIADLKLSLEMERRGRQAAEARLFEKHQELSRAGLSALESRRRLELALWAASEAIWEWNQHNDQITIQSFHQQYEDMTALLPKQLSRAQYVRFTHREDQPAMQVAWNLVMSGRRADLEVEHRICLDRKSHWLRIRGRCTEVAADGSPLRLVGTLRDITQQRLMEHSSHLMAHAFTSSPDALVITDSQWQIIEANTAFHLMVGVEPRPETTLLLADFMDVDTLVDEKDPSSRLWRQEAALIDMRGVPIPVDVTVSAFHTSHTESICHVLAIRDITDRKKAAARLEWFAHYDPLTELMNRNALEQHLARLFDPQEVEPFALMFIDLDGFKEVNDSLGHNNGDLLLKEIALRLQVVMNNKALVSRWGGDEFVVVLHPPSGQQEVMDTSSKLIARLTEPISIGPHCVTITPSIGVALAPLDGQDASTLLRRADSAMYAAKDGGRNRVEFYRSELDADLLHRMQLMSFLRQAADRDDFHFVVQPKVKSDGVVIGGEILIRWAPESLGNVPPGTFISLAEEIGVIRQIGRLALNRAAEFAAAVAKFGHHWPVSVNLSSRQVADINLEKELLSACERYQISPHQLELEVTESAFISNVVAAKRVLQRLHDLGFILSLDDFGTGYSALSYLRELPFDKVKIDRSFVTNIERDERARALVQGIAALCKTLKMQIVAEGVETIQQLTLLQSFEFDEYQGFWFSRPLNLSDCLAINAPLPLMNHNE